MRKRQRTINDSDVIVGEYFTSVYKFWSDGRFRSKYLYDNEGNLLNVFNYTYEIERFDDGNNGKYF
jgi:hypothetical protein|tara:strand:- start:658 stop:855 length:198 start_codon:yes stop_codon:yes gene_type:complete